MRYRGTVAMAVAVMMCAMTGTALAQGKPADLGKREFDHALPVRPRVHDLDRGHLRSRRHGATWRAR